MALDAYQLLIGPGRIYVAPLTTAFPLIDASPSTSWLDLGETYDGVSITPSEDIADVYVDGRTGPVKATRTKEGLEIKTKFAAITVENLAKFLSGSLNDVAPGAGIAGYRSTALHRGLVVNEYSILLRGKSPYGDFNAQYQIPRAYFKFDGALELKKGAPTQIPVSMIALEDLNAAPGSNLEFGHWVAEDEAGT